MRTPDWYTASVDGTTNYGHYVAMAAPGPLMRTLSMLRRVRRLLDEPEPVRPEKRNIAAGSFSGNLFADSVEHDMLHLLDEEEDDGPGRTPPSFGEEWARLLDRTFARVRYALRREGRYSQLEEIRFEPHMGIPGVPVGGWRNMDGHNLSGILRELTRVANSLESISDSLLRVETRDAEFEEAGDPAEIDPLDGEDRRPSSDDGGPGDLFTGGDQ